jgi:hypothetical protein
MPDTEERLLALRRRTIDPARLVGVASFVFDDGTRRGVRALQARNADGLELTVIPERGLDACELRFRGRPVTWYGPGNAVAARSLDPNEDAFARSFFGGLVTTCGMDAFGDPGADRYGSWPQHGHQSRLAASDVRITTHLDDDDAHLAIGGTIRQFAMFGAALRVERTWRIDAFANVVALHDRVTNDGGSPTPQMVLYHCNVGHPFLSEATRWTFPAPPPEPRDDEARAGLAFYDRGGAPEAAFAEQVFLHRPVAGAEGWAHARAHDPAFGGTLDVAFRPEQLPALFSWRMLGFGTYVMAVEPANCGVVQGRARAEAEGVLPMLAAGESRDYDLRFTIASDAS